MKADLIVRNGRLTALGSSNPKASAVAITNWVFSAVGHKDVMPLVGPPTRSIDLTARRALPGLIDNHLHINRSCWAIQS
jgi:predicted amidohydrolase YtcJ